MRFFERTSRVSLRLLTLASLVCAPVWGAATLTIKGTVANGGTGLTSDVTTTDNCMNLADVVLGKVCTDTAFVSNTMAGISSTFVSASTFNGNAPTTQTFMSGFTNGANGWKMVNGGTLDLTIDVSRFTSNALGPYVGGMTVQADVSNYNPANQVVGPNGLANGVTAPLLSQLAWTQALYINYQPNDGPATPAKPANTLDDYTFVTGGTGKPVPVKPGDKKDAFNRPPMEFKEPMKNGYSYVPANTPAVGFSTAYNDPIYPFQGPGTPGFPAPSINSIADMPRGYYQTPASFRAIALLSAINPTTKTITIFNDGIDYGFDLKTPEPSLRMVSVLLSAMLFIAYRQRGNA